MLGVALLSLLTASAQEPADADAPSLEIIVQESVNVVKARADLDLALEELGYPGGIALGRRTLYLHVQPWKPHVVVFEAGFARVHGHLVTPLAPLISALPWAAGTNGAQVQVPGVWADPRTMHAMEARVVDALRPWIRDWQDAMADEALAIRQEQLRVQSRAIWERGLSPDGGALDSVEARRLALAGLWLNTADNAAGATARAIVMDYIDQVVQRSGAPFTEAEVEAINAARGFEAAFWPRPPL
ncbi:MAG: hypothetical protein H6741_24685 [Alphaproteobacteria bacterium]|nr:hypothetical protein [Alphaproteobacteria bacterium]